MAGRAGANNLNTDRFSTIEIALPPLAEQHRIVAEVERRLQIVYDLEDLVSLMLEDAGKLRRSILTRAFEGRLAIQGPDDEHASKLLEHIALERQSHKEASMKKKKTPSEKSDKKTDVTTPAGTKAPGQDRLTERYKAFAKTERPAVEDLFRACGYSFDSKDDADIYYFFELLAKELMPDELNAARLTLERDDNDDVFVIRSMA
jgi:hypothetical protein